MKEIWKDIKDFEGYYQVSNLGNVRSLNRVIERADSSANYNGRLLSKCVNSYGYEFVTLFKRNFCLGKRVNRLVAIAFIDNPKNKKEVNHIDGNKLNNSVDNLEWCSISENVKHAFKLGLRSNKGEDNPVSKLDCRKVIRIRELEKQGFSREKLAKMFSVSVYTIKDVCLRRTWKHI